jgi:hypothetical protein
MSANSIEHTERTERIEQEDDRVASRKVLAVFATAIVVTVVAVWGQGRMLAAKRTAIGAHDEAAAPVADRQIAGMHQTLLERDRHGLDLREEQRASLTRGAWIDRDHALAKIPIDRAMDVLAAHPELAGAVP